MKNTAKLIFITHPEVEIDPDRAITDWGLSTSGRFRASTFAASTVLSDLSAIWCSTERKARETAEAIASSHKLTIRYDANLGENDRSATGFLPRDAFEAAADAFFARPEVSFNGWEKAIDAQARITKVVRSLVSQQKEGSLAIVSHGAVGTLLWCALKGLPIDRRHDQPSQGHYWCADITSLEPQTGWLPIN